MELDWGAFGAAARGENVGEFKRGRSEEERRKKEEERQDTERKQYEEIIKSTHGEFKEGLKAAGGAAMPMQDAYGAEPAKPGMVMDDIVSNQVSGRQPAPGSVNSIVAQGVGGSTAAPQPSSKPLSAAAQGIMRPTAEAEMLQQTRVKEPTYREPDINDKFNYSDKLYGRLIEAGLFDKAKEVGQFRSGLLAEKLQGETKAREDAVRGGVAAIKSRNPKAILAALQSVSQFVPDGNDVTDVQMSGDGKYQITYGDNPPIAMDEGQLTSSILGAGKVETILDYDHRLQQTAFQKAQEERQTKKDERDATHQTDTLAETKRNHIATEGIARTKAVEGSEATTAEIKNARVFFPELYAKKPADALSAFKDLTNGEKDASAVRMKLNAIYSDSMKGGWPKEAGKSQQERDVFLEKRVNYFMGKADAQSFPPPEKREIGKAYQTPKGMMIWRGNGWSAN